MEQALSKMLALFSFVLKGDFWHVFSLKASGWRLSTASALLMLGAHWPRGHKGGCISIILVATFYVRDPKATEASKSLSRKDSKLSSNLLNRCSISPGAPAYSEIGGIESFWDWLCSLGLNSAVSQLPSMVHHQCGYELFPSSLLLIVSTWRKVGRILFWICKLERSWL